ncbi:hypothetical protein [Crateriforma spongiae]|uniref:hypothetical protein n=1 Tax=Crateriforma spongiae TaxID=2724528 RepID=UPI0039AFF749
MKSRFAAIGRMLMVLGGCCVGGLASAHPGHGLVDEGPVHQATSPEHFLSIVVAALFVGGLAVLSAMVRKPVSGKTSSTNE